MGIRWRSDVPADTRAALEQRLHLLNPTQIEGSRWGYILGDRSPANVAMLAGVPGATAVEFVDGDPPQLNGPSIIRMAGPFAVQSYIALGLGLFVLLGSFAPTRRLRQVYVLGACALLAVSWVLCPLPVSASNETHFWMGDFNTYTEDRAHFNSYFGIQESVRFHFHLVRPVLFLLDLALGSTDTSPSLALLVLSWLAGGVFLAGAVAIAHLEGWSAHVMRYLALAVAMPTGLFFFGYREVGYLPLSVTAFPLLVRGLTGTPGRRLAMLTASGAIHGLRSALHGFGLVALAGSIVAAMTQPAPLRGRLADAWTLLTSGATAYLIWLPWYLIVLGRDIVPGHAAGIPLRGLLQQYAAEGRTVMPLLSPRGFSDVWHESLAVGVLLLMIGLVAGAPSAERRIAAGYSLISVAALMLIWPAQGIGLDIDTVFAIFPAVYAGAWLCAHSRRATGLGFVVAAVAHGVFWALVRHNEFVNIPLP